MKIDNFFAELKRRNVYRVAVAYAIVAWLLIQVVTQVFPFFGIPNWAVRLVVLLLILGFPVALILSWAFEITPEGIKRSEDVAPNESIRRQTGRKIVGITVALAVIAAALFLFRLLQTKATEGPVTKPAATASMIPAKSIAVLPFENLSEEKGNAYFAEGIQEEILTRLANIAELKVISRTSTQRFKSSPDNVREIAQQLGVAHILEGSVQRAADQVRVNVQLINAQKDTHLWAETYDRKLTDIFAVEGEIARSVAEMLQAKLTGSAERLLASRPTENPEAHQLYLKGRSFWNKRTTEALKKAIDYFQQAIAKDSNYALAFAGLADAYALLPIYASLPPKDDIPRALAAAHKALELDDSLAEAHTALANALVLDLQFATAEPEFRRAIALNPNYGTAHQWYGECLAAEGRFDQALSQLNQARVLDPLSLIINSVLGSILGLAGRHDEAIAQLRKTIEIDPTFNTAHLMLAQVLEDKGDLKGAIAEYQTFTGQLIASPTRLASLAHIYGLTNQKEDARKILDDLTNLSRQQHVPAYPLAIIHLALGERAEALALLEKSYDDRDMYLEGNFGSIKTDRRLDPLRGDPRFQKLLGRFTSVNPE